MRSRVGRVILFSVFMLPVLFAVLNFVPENEVLQSPQAKFAPFDASVTIQNNNPPEITEFNPPVLNIEAIGEEDLHFNLSFIDADNNELLVSWYADGNLIEEGFDEGDGFDEFNFDFSCGIEGERSILAVVSDGFDMDSVEWNIDLALRDCSSGGNEGQNGGSNSDTGNSSFSVSRSFVQKSLFPGEIGRESVIINNTGSTDLDFEFSLSGMGNLASLSAYNFSLDSGKSRFVDINFQSSRDQQAGVYTGNLAVESGALAAVVNLVLEILDKESLFDVRVSLLDDIITEKDKIEAVVDVDELSNLGEIGVHIGYFVKDYDGSEIKLFEEDLMITGSQRLERSFDLPSELGFGNYLFYVKLTYEEKIAVASQPFRISSVGFWYKLIMTLIIVDIIILVLAIAYYIYRKKSGLI